MLKEKGHPIITAAAARFVGAEADDDATVVVTLRAEARRATCRCSSRPADLLARLLRDADFRRIDARSAARLRPLQGRPLRARPLHRIRAREGLVGRRPAGLRAARTISTSCASNIYRDRDVGFEGFTGKNYLFREEFTSRIWATRYDFPAIKDGRVKRDVFPTTRRPARRAGSSTRGASKFKDPRVREALIDRLRFRMDQQDHHVRRLQAHAFGVPEFRHDGEGQAGRRTSWRCSSRSAARCRTRCSASRSCRRCPTARARTARCCARRRNCSARPAAPSRTASASMPKGERCHDRVPDRRADLPAAPHAVHQEPSRARHRRDVAHGRSGAVPRARRRFRLRHHGRSASASRDAGRLAAHLFLLQSAATKGSSNLAGIADRSSTR